MKNSNLRNIVIASFISVPLISSIISMVHLVDLFSLGNPGWMAKTVAFAIELGAIASFMALSIMGKLNKFFVWAVFIVLFIMQLIGNIYYSYNFVSQQILINANWVSSFKEMYEFFFDKTTMLDIKMYLSILIASVIPIISIFLLKSLTEYLGTDIPKEIEKEETLIEETASETEDLIKEEDNDEEKEDFDVVNKIEDNIESPTEEFLVNDTKETDVITPPSETPSTDISFLNNNHVVPAARTLHPAHMSTN